MTNLPITKPSPRHCAKSSPLSPWEKVQVFGWSRVRVFWKLVIGIWNLFGNWDLVIGYLGNSV